MRWERILKSILCDPPLNLECRNTAAEQAAPQALPGSVVHAWCCAPERGARL
jgi:hypothetical protein